ncbi:hypothetical protein chiPu_0009615 [Chiloscyllium punctatum]|uniref:Uncharacterized protein n=1 Tax=Chiloscyllium punctatum TaxID=137246 RepID=A0A401SLA8_CHIPU|nr:hypothetical protein [Chiloscyllium punctatum]
MRVGEGGKGKKKPTDVETAQQPQRYGVSRSSRQSVSMATRHPGPSEWRDGTVPSAGTCSFPFLRPPFLDFHDGKEEEKETSNSSALQPPSFPRNVHFSFLQRRRQTLFHPASSVVAQRLLSGAGGRSKILQFVGKTRTAAPKPKHSFHKEIKTSQNCDKVLRD